MSLLRGPLIALARGIIACMCRVEAGELARLPREGGFILAFNHVNFLEAPLLVSRLWPRPLATFAKRETWRNPLLGWLTSLFGGIPVSRGSADSGAMRRALAALEGGTILLFSPEGTRHRDGRLGQAHGGIVPLALRSGLPVFPVAISGHTGILESLGRGKRPTVSLRVGEALRVLPPPPGEARQARAEAADEIMRRIARLLPEENRGCYAAGLDRPERRIASIG
jgi:1-acyl-sn-glycerol-3-phosphate acyltransferase